jgi:acetate CoA/acetoacetate CoA-transferase beta subunit
MMDKQAIQEFIARRVALEVKQGDLVNLGIGLPSLVANFVPAEKEVIFQSENGCIRLGPAPDPEDIDPCVTNAGAIPASILPGGAFIDSAMSFGIIRGGHVDVTVLGALQVAENGDIANYMIPGKMVPGMGGAMDLLSGAKKVIVAMEHTAKGAPKLVKSCDLPLTAVNAVDLIITEMGVIEVNKDGFLLVEYNPEYSIDEIRQNTAAALHISPGLKEMTL